MTLSVLQNSSHTIYDTVPFGTLYRVGPFFFDRPGTYTTILRSANGCDSVLTLHIVFSSNGRIITSVGGNYGSVGDTVLVPVTITNRTVFSGFSYFIDFDSSLLHFVGLDSVASVFTGALRCVDTTRLTPAGIRKNIFVDGNWANLIATRTLNVGYLKFRIMRLGPAVLSWV
ncbi:MAG: cohesin domain-containing protein, partial [Bacteroidota bacterium]